MLALLAATVDELDYGLLLLDRSSHVVHANHAARCEFNATHPLRLLQDRLQATDPHDGVLLRDALADVFQRGHRKLLYYGLGARRISLSLVPLAPGGTAPKWALVLLGKPQVCQDLSVEAYARTHKLTPVETQVLKGLCRWCPPCRDRAQPQRRVVDGAHARRQHPLQDQCDLDRCAGANRIDAAADGQRVAADAALMSGAEQVRQVSVVVDLVDAAGRPGDAPSGLLLLTP